MAYHYLARWGWLHSIVVACAVFTWSGWAHACGGLFCSSSGTVNQVAERIIFAQNDDDTITAVIEIRYQGPADAFAWVLPVPSGSVDVGVSSSQILDDLQTVSNPRYNFQTSFGPCADAGAWH